jgi:hypothetical protein
MIAKLSQLYTVEHYAFIRNNKVDLRRLRYWCELVLEESSLWLSHVSYILSTQELMLLFQTIL